METPLAPLELAATLVEPPPPLEEPTAAELPLPEDPATLELPAAELPMLAPLDPMALEPGVLDAMTLEDPARDEEPAALEPPTLEAPMLEPPPPVEEEEEDSPVPLFPVHAAPNPATTTAARPIRMRIMCAPML